MSTALCRWPNATRPLRESGKPIYRNFNEFATGAPYGHRLKGLEQTAHSGNGRRGSEDYGASHCCSCPSLCARDEDQDFSEDSWGPDEKQGQSRQTQQSLTVPLIKVYRQHEAHRPRSNSSAPCSPGWRGRSATGNGFSKLMALNKSSTSLSVCRL